MEMENMTRGHGWAFLDLGRRVERGVFVARLMRAVVMAGADAEEVVEPALEIADSVMTHRRRYFSEPRVATVMEVLVRDATNPRSLAFQVASVAEHARKLPTGPNPEGLEALRGMAAELESELAGATRRGDAFDATLLGSLGGRLARFSERLTEIYFSHVMPRVS